MLQLPGMIHRDLLVCSLHLDHVLCITVREVRVQHSHLLSPFRAVHLDDGDGVTRFEVDLLASLAHTEHYVEGLQPVR